MRLLAFLSLIGLAFGNALPGFRYAYVIPQAGEGQPWSQFNERSDDRFAWGYEYPGRVHFQSQDGEGVVKGSFGFVDANGSPNIWKYISHPNTGFKVDIAEGPVLPEASSVGEEPSPSWRNGGPVPATFTRAQQVEESISPLLKNAAAAGYVIPAGASPSGTPQFAIDIDLINEFNGVSALAEHFGAVPVAAVHDVQSRPSYAIPKSAFAPVLVHRDEPDVTLYTLEVPVQ